MPIDTVHIQCNYCESDDYDVIFPSTIGDRSATTDEYVSTTTKYSDYHNIVKCRECGLIYMNPRDRDIASLYEDVVDDKYLTTWQERKGIFRDLIRKIGKFMPSGRLLDVGTYAGIFCETAIEAGYDVTGVEPSAWGAAYASERTGANVIQGTAEKVDLGEKTFDLITMWDVVEHMEDPHGCFRKLHDHLASDGILAVTTHDIGSLVARLMGKRYPWLMRFHLYHFTPEMLIRVCNKAGFECVHKEYFVKKFSLSYLLSRLGINAAPDIFNRILIPVYMRDMFLCVFRKTSATD
ncbi:class I SAM-dependent methyltransferase [Nitrospirota bacterium]